MFFKPKGSITVFLCIILAVLIPLTCILIDLARISSAKSQAKTALKICTESMLAAYDRQLKEQYGLFSLYPQDMDAMQKEVYELMCENLNTEASIDGVTDLYGFKVREVEVIPFYNYSEPFVLQQQVAEFMKYRAPIQVVQEFYEKIKVMVGLIKEGEMIERKMAIDKLLNDIRSDLVNISCMLNEVLSNFNALDNNSKTTLKESSLSEVDTYLLSAKSDISNANEYVDPIKEARDGYNSIYDDYISSKENYESLVSQLNKVSKNLEDKKAKLAKIEEQIETADEKKSESLEKDKTELENEIASLQSNYDSINSSCNSAYETYLSYEREINNYKNIIDEGLDFVISSFYNALGDNMSAEIQINILKNYIEDYILYHKDIIKIIEGLNPKLQQLDKETQSLKDDANKNESGVSNTIKGSLEKQIKSVEIETFNEVKNRLALNLQKLESWNQSIEEYLGVLNTCIKDLRAVLKTAEEVKSKPHNKNKSYEGYMSYQNTVDSFSKLETHLSDLSAKGSIKGVYEVPDYNLEPTVNTIEKESFDKWFEKNYEGKKPKKESLKDDAELKKVREGVGSLANTAANQEIESNDEYEDINPDSADIKERFLSLPSKKGATSSDDAIAKIGRAIQESKENQIVRENPFGKPSEGLNTVNENEKNFFDHEMDRIRKLLNIINDAISNNIESLIEGLYMNEYIVSAFKCATSVNGIEHDIGWGRPLDKTFFKQAEVEYILFGNKTAKENIVSVKRSIFAVRLLFNLLHVYTDADKVATALSLATAIAGWTIFGIPIVQNFILIAWAGAESYVDTDFLIKGKMVPLIKTSSSWQLDVGSLKDKLKEILTKDIKTFIQDKIENAVDQASEAAQETVAGIINGMIDQAFAPVEKGINELPGESDNSVEADINNLLMGFGQDFINNLNFDGMDSFTASLESSINNLVNNVIGQIKGYSQEKLLQFKNEFKKKIINLIFQSPGYKELEKSLKKLGNDLLDKGINAVEGQIDNVFGAANKSGRNNITGRLIMMDYVDYMRLLLLAIPAETKALRTADLMQLNMQEVAKKNDLLIGQYNTFLFIKVELDINTWFIPKSMLRKGNSGMISIEWSQGY